MSPIMKVIIEMHQEESVRLLTILKFRKFPIKTIREARYLSWFFLNRMEVITPRAMPREHQPLIIKSIIGKIKFRSLLVRRLSLRIPTHLTLSTMGRMDRIGHQILQFRVNLMATQITLLLLSVSMGILIRQVDLVVTSFLMNTIRLMEATSVIAQDTIMDLTITQYSKALHSFPLLPTVACRLHHSKAQVTMLERDPRSLFILHLLRKLSSLQPS